MEQFHDSTPLRVGNMLNKLVATWADESSRLAYAYYGHVNFGLLPRDWALSRKYTVAMFATFFVDQCISSPDLFANQGRYDQFLSDNINSLSNLIKKIEQDRPCGAESKGFSCFLLKDIHGKKHYNPNRTEKTSGLTKFLKRAAVSLKLANDASHWDGEYLFKAFEISAELIQYFRETVEAIRASVDSVPQNRQHCAILAARKEIWGLALSPNAHETTASFAFRVPRECIYCFVERATISLPCKHRVICSTCNHYISDATSDSHFYGFPSVFKIYPFETFGDCVFCRFYQATRSPVIS